MSLSEANRPGRNVRLLEAKRTNRALWLGGGSVVIALVALAVVWLSPVAVFLAAPLALLSIFLGNQLNKQSQLVYNARRGAQAEEYVGRTLETKLPEWRIIHNLLLPGLGDIDHILVGPGGVVLVETKSQPGKLILNRGRVGFRQPLGIRWSGKDLIHQTRSLTEALRTKNFLVTPFLCFPYAQVEPNKIKGIQILDLPQLLSAIQALPTILTPEDIESSYQQLLTNITDERV